MSLRGRLLLAVVGLLVVGLLVADAATYVSLRAFLLTQTDAQLVDASEALGRTPDGYPGGGGNGGGRNPRHPVPTEGLDGLLEGRIQRDDTVTWTRAGYDALEPSSTPAVTAAMVQAAGVTAAGAAASGSATPSRNARATAFTVPSAEGDGPSYRVLITVEPDGDTTVAAVPLTVVENTLNRLLGIEALVTLGVVIASVGVGLWLVRVGLRPLEDIAGTAAEIAAGDLSRRVELADEHTEVGRLGSSLNTMLGQIETAFAERQASEAALVRSEEKLRRFVADASHELRTPLAAVQAYAELFDRGGSEHPEDLPRLLGNIQKESARMAVLVDDLLLLTRLDQGRPLDRSPVDLAAIVADAVEAARAVDPDRRIAVVADDSVEVVGDRVRLRQIADNLLTNARVHTPADTPIEVLAHAVDGFGVLAVADHGPGLTEDQASKVFERFYRADESRTRADGGTGLGLSIVAAIALAHGGVADVQPTPGGGATFRVAIPLLDPAGAF